MGSLRIYASNAVLEMYVKCGKIDAAWRVFNEIGSLRNLCSWNSMVVGLAVHGECCKALELYDQMLVSSLVGLVINFLWLNYSFGPYNCLHFMFSLLV